MPRYYFHLRNGAGFVEDEEGRDLPDPEAARSEALKGVRSILCEDVLGGVVDLRGSLEVVDQDGVRILLLPFAEAVEFRT